MVGETARAVATPSRAPAGSWLRPVCERLISALDVVRGDHDRDPLASRAALRNAVSAYVTALRAEGIPSPVGPGERGGLCARVSATPRSRHAVSGSRRGRRRPVEPGRFGVASWAWDRAGGAVEARQPGYRVKDYG